MIKFNVNNGRSLELTQSEPDGIVNVEHWSSEGQKESNMQIAPGDFVMLLNYYQWVKESNIQCDFVNPHGKEQ